MSAIVFCLSFLSISLYQFALIATQEARLDALPKADAIVVLTGEDTRIHSAVELLKQAHGKRLLISGVSEKVSDKTIIKAYAPSTTTANCCIDMDRLSLDTEGNAEHTAKWASLHGFNRLIVVTSSYHMPRSLDHLRRKMPLAELIPAQVIPQDLKGKNALSMMFSPKIMIEYGKLLLTRLKLEPVAKYMWTSLESSVNG
jgi:uncharacterized SAM-binding protein YcdF (DUF218 family)